MLGGHVLSHDQIEAALMRRAGYDVRVLPEEDLGWEENPPTLIEFIRRDLRWCQGTLQYGISSVMPGMKPVSRFQLAFAMLMFLGSPAWIGLLVIGTLGARALAHASRFHPPRRRRVRCSSIILVMWFAPKIATVLDVLTRAELRRAFGGTARFLASVATETIFFILLSPIMWVCHTLFLAGLPFGRAIGWIGQVRDDHTVPWSRRAAAALAAHRARAACIARLARRHASGRASPMRCFIAGGPRSSIPLAVFTARPALGAAARPHRHRPAAGGNRAAARAARRSRCPRSTAAARAA